MLFQEKTNSNNKAHRANLNEDRMAAPSTFLASQKYQMEESPNDNKVLTFKWHGKLI